MNILFFTYDFPYPTTSGGKMRAYNLIKFGRRKNTITLFSFTREDYKKENNSQLNKIGVESIYTFKRPPLKNIKNLSGVLSINSSIFKALYYSKEVERKLFDVIKKEKIDVVHFESFYTSYYMSDTVRKMNVKQIYGTENLEYKNYEAFTKKIPFLINFPFKLQVRNVRNEESHFAKLSDITLAVTEEEAKEFQKMGARNTEVVPNGVDINHFAFKPNHRPQGRKILFVGNFSYFPNRQGIEYFYNTVFKNLGGDYNLVIIGKDASTLKIQDTRVGVVEYIDDIREAYYSADVFVSPIKIGGGTNFKIIEAMACGLPVIADPSRIHALGLTPDEEVVIAKDPEEFRIKLEVLLQNDGLQGRLARNARSYIEKNYSWDVIGKKLNQIWERGQSI